MIGHQGASTVGDMTQYVRTLHAMASARARIVAARLKRRIAGRGAPDGEKWKNAQATAPAIGTNSKRVAITVAL